MKKTICLFLFLAFGKPIAQTSDSIQIKKNTANYYIPFKKLKNDSLIRISKFGHYVSIGTGAEHDYLYSGLAIGRVSRASQLLNGPNSYGSYGSMVLASYSLAYKSNLLSATFGYSSKGIFNSIVGGYVDKYFALLYGPCLRYKHLMVSVSGGLSLSYLLVANPITSQYYEQPLVYGRWGKIAFPFDVKTFLMARNCIGIGIHLASNVVPTPKFTSYYAGLSVVFGVWNKQKSSSKKLEIQPEKRGVK